MIAKSKAKVNLYNRSYYQEAAFNYSIVVQYEELILNETTFL